MSYYVARVGELIIKPEYRKDMAHMFRAEYHEVEDKELCDFIEKNDLITDHYIWFLPLASWEHQDFKDEWSGKYKTTYDEVTGHFVYGVCYNQASRGFAMWDFFDLLKKMTQQEIFSERWSEADLP